MIVGFPSPVDSIDAISRGEAVMPPVPQEHHHHHAEEDEHSTEKIALAEGNSLMHYDVVTLILKSSFLL